MLEKVEIIYNQVHEAISVMKEVAKWGREQGFCVWLDEKVVRKIYLNAGFKIVDIIDYDNGRSMALYEMEV